MNKIDKLLNKMDWEFITFVRNTMFDLQMPCPTGSMRKLGRELLLDLYKSKRNTTEIKSGLLVASRQLNEEGKVVYTLSFTPEEVSTDYL